MKKLLFAAAMMIASVTASAQLYLGGSFGLYRNSTTETTHFTVAPEIGYEYNSKWSFGAELGLNYDKTDDFSSTVFEVQPYARYNYFRSSNNLVNLFVDGTVGLGFGKADGDTAVPFSIGFRPGIAFNLTEKFALVAHLGFLGYTGGNDAAKEAGYPEIFGLDFSTMNLSFGFHYIF